MTPTWYAIAITTWSASVPLTYRDIALDGSRFADVTGKQPAAGGWPKTIAGSC
jgi:hypothetical protein